ncbi:MAG: radical SAM family heme chaperone HemW [Chitinophagaceae bacterium]
MAGIYIHIPFCRQACNYCNFHFSTSLRYKNELMAALLKEVELFPTVFPDEMLQVTEIGQAGDRALAPLVETIYIGGGTPSLLENTLITGLLAKIRSVFRVSDNAEVTLEANPDDITEDKLIEWKNAGINRLSIGVQSFFEEDLRWMNRAHNAFQAETALRLAIKHFDNITMDLIYGTPGLTDEKWKFNVEKAISLGVPHLSCYALTVEPNTPLQKLISGHKREDVDPDKQSAQFILLMHWLKTAGFEHYEISNFARPGFRSRHNSSYWQGKPYYGFGPSAHSYNGRERWWNIANNARYITSVNDGAVPVEKEILTSIQRYNEYIMISLRTGEGLRIDRILDNEWGFDKTEHQMLVNDLLEKAKDHEARGLVQLTDGRIILTMEGKLLADGIASDLFAEGS